MLKGNINLNLYKTFYDVARYGSFSKAAEFTYTTQPAISKSIKKLENDLETELFYRKSNGIELTEKGRELLFYVEKSYGNLLTAERILLETEELKQFKFLKRKFEKIELESNNLVVANFSLPFCNKNDFKKLWNKIDDSILKDGYFVGNFFGDNDEWKNTKEEMTFLTKKQVIELFENFEIIEFNEVEKDDFTGLGKMKHWHIFNVIAKKI